MSGRGEERRGGRRRARVGVEEQHGDGQGQIESVLRLVWYPCAPPEAFCDECCTTGRLSRRWPLSLGRLGGAEESA